MFFLCHLFSVRIFCHQRRFCGICFGSVIQQSYIPVVDLDFLHCVSGVLLGAFSDGDLLDEGSQDLRGQFIDLAVFLCVFNEPGNIGCGGLQFLQPCFCHRKSFTELLLFLGVTLGQDAVLLIGDSAKDIILIQSLEQSSQFCLSPIQSIHFTLKLSDLFLGFLTLLLADMLCKQHFILPCNVCHPADVI